MIINWTLEKLINIFIFLINFCHYRWINLVYFDLWNIITLIFIIVFDYKLLCCLILDWFLNLKFWFLNLLWYKIFDSQIQIIFLINSLELIYILIDWLFSLLNLFIIYRYNMLNASRRILLFLWCYFLKLMDFSHRHRSYTLKITDGWIYIISNLFVIFIFLI